MRLSAIAVVILAGTAPASVTMIPGEAWAGAIERACLKAGRKNASRSLCGCIQQVADVTLTGSQQRRGAKYFFDPAKLQEVRQSDRRSDEAFWKDWKAFGKSAETYCAN